MNNSSEYTILIVDDIPRNIQLIANILQRQKYNFNFAKSGKEALQLVANNKYDLILLDIMMPEMDGLEVCKLLKQKLATKDIPVIFISASNDIDNITSGFALGGVDYITKPFNDTELLARIKTHLQLKETENKLKQLNETKDKFFSIIAHDIKNPFSVVMQNAKVLFEKFDDYDLATLKRFANRTYTSSHRLYNLLENLLEWSQLQTGTYYYSPSDVDLEDTITTNMEIFSEQAERKNISINYTPGTCKTVYADKYMFSTIVRNLISNALKFSNDNTEIKISVIENEFETGVRVSDNGMGISELRLKDLLSIANYESTPGTNNERGSGLGLLITKEFLDIHKGRITIDSRLGHGSVFSVYFPNKTNT